MSAVNIAMRPDSILMMTDTKTTDPDGLQYNSSKVALFPHGRMAIAVRGYLATLRVFERLFSMNAPEYHHALMFIANRWNDILASEYSDPYEAFAMKQDMDLYVVGWNKLNRPDGFWISNYQAGRALQRMEGPGFFLCTPMVSYEAREKFRGVEDLPELMRAQAREHVGVGGQIICTEIKEDGIHSFTYGALCELGSVAQRMQPDSEKEELARIKEAKAARAARIAAVF